MNRNSSWWTKIGGGHNKLCTSVLNKGPSRVSSCTFAELCCLLFPFNFVSHNLGMQQHFKFSIEINMICSPISSFLNRYCWYHSQKNLQQEKKKTLFQTLFNFSHLSFWSAGRFLLTFRIFCTYSWMATGSMCPLFKNFKGVKNEKYWVWHVLSSCRMLRKFLVRFSKWLQSVKKVL